MENKENESGAAAQGEKNKGTDTLNLTASTQSINADDPVINDDVTSLTQTWSSQKISDQLSYNSDYIY